VAGPTAPFLIGRFDSQVRRLHRFCPFWSAVA
jgi:hypothetical protein